MDRGRRTFPRLAPRAGRGRIGSINVTWARGGHASTRVFREEVMQLKGQAAIVTGGASGLGAATARKLAAQGAKVAVCDLNAKLAESVAAEIGGVAVVCDVSDSASAEAAV